MQKGWPLQKAAYLELQPGVQSHTWQIKCGKGAYHIAMYTTKVTLNICQDHRVNSGFNSSVHGYVTTGSLWMATGCDLSRSYKYNT